MMMYTARQPTENRRFRLTANEQVSPEFWDGEPLGSPYFPRIFVVRMGGNKKADAVKLFVKGWLAE
jgi:hypothetical protein